MVRLRIRFMFVALLLVVGFLLSFTNPTIAEARSFTIDKTDIQAFIRPNGNVYVEELFTYTFKGKYNGTTRTFGTEHYDGLDFFDGYEVDIGTTFGTIDQENMKPLEVELDKDDTFKIHNLAEDETKQVLYSYELRGAARKFADVGEFYWRFFDKVNEEDIHNLDINIYLYKEKKSIILPEDSYGFMHDLHGGTYEMTDYGLHYENDMLPSGEFSEVRLLFPETFLSDMQPTENFKKRDTILREEATFEKRLKRRDKWMPLLNVIDFVFLILTFFLLLFVIFFPKRIIHIFSGKGDIDLVNKMSSLTIVALHRRLRFRYTDINAALFTMHQEGKVRMEYKMKDEGPTFIYILTKPVLSLKQHEQFLVNWLFTQTKDDYPVFSLDQIPVNDREGTSSEKYHASESYRSFRKEFKKWYRLVKKDEDVAGFIGPVYLRKALYLGVVPFWLLWGCVHLFFSVRYNVDVIGALSVLLIGLLLLSKKVRRERIWTPIILIGSIIISQYLRMDQDYALFYVAQFHLILVAIILPGTYPTIKGIKYKKGLKAWKSSLQEGSLLMNHSDELERAFQHAISIEGEDVFCHHYLKNINPAETAQVYPLLIAPQVTNDIFDYIHVNSFESLLGSGGSSGSSGGRSSGGSGGGGGAGAF